MSDIFEGVRGCGCINVAIEVTFTHWRVLNDIKPQSNPIPHTYNNISHTPHTPSREERERGERESRAEKNKKQKVALTLWER